MQHYFIDKYSNLNSIVHRLDPRTKIITFFLYVILVVLTEPTEFPQFTGYAILILSLIFVSRIPINYVLKRSLVIFPFVFLVIIFVPFYRIDNAVGIYKHGRFLVIWNVMIKSWLSALAMITLTSTTKFSILLKGLEKLFVPKVLIMSMSFMYRYIFVLIDEVQRLERARNSRYFGGEFTRQIKVFSNMIGLLFIRAYNRAERVYQSMVARGFDGDIKTLSTLSLSNVDIGFVLIFLFVILTIKIWC